MPGSTIIENYEPEDYGWGVVIGPFMRPPAKEDDDLNDSQSSEAEDE
jgi:hypothetical protein